MGRRWVGSRRPRARPDMMRGRSGSTTCRWPRPSTRSSRTAKRCSPSTTSPPPTGDTYGPSTRSSPPSPAAPHPGHQRRRRQPTRPGDGLQAPRRRPTPLAQGQKSRTRRPRPSRRRVQRRHPSREENRPVRGRRLMPHPQHLTISRSLSLWAVCYAIRAPAFRRPIGSRETVASEPPGFSRWRHRWR